jgi:hypothetical protein
MEAKRTSVLYVSFWISKKSFFGNDGYTLPVTSANLCGTFRKQFCWFLSHLRKDSGCAFCALILQTLNLSHDVENIESGIGHGAERRAV